MHEHPTTGIKAAKPRFKPAKEELPELSRQYLETRNQQMSLKAQAAAMELAERRGELIERRLVEQQAAYLLVCLRQAVLRLPAECAPRLAGLTDAHEIRQVLEGAVRALLAELVDMPNKVVDPDWLAKVEEDGGRGR